MGWGGRLNKDAQKVILQGYIQGSSITDSQNGGRLVRGRGWICCARDGTTGGSGLQGGPAPLDLTAA